MTQYIGYARMKARWRLTTLPMPPATVVIANERADGSPPIISRKGASLTLSGRWLDFIRRINPSAKAQQQVLGKARGWVNGSGGSSHIVSESVDFAGNVSGVLDRAGAFLWLDALGASDPAPDPSDGLHVHLLTAVTFNGQLRLFADGVRAWYPFLTNGEAWVHEDLVDFFTVRPEPIWPGGVPVDLGGYAAVTRASTAVFQRPEVTAKVGVLPAGYSVRVSSEVRGFAKIGERRWVPLTTLRTR